MQEENEDLYEMVPMDPLRKLKVKGSELEKEIDAIKDILKDTVTISKLNAGAEELVGKIIQMIKISQDMVEAVSRSNQDLGRQLNASVKEMTNSNRELSHKLDALLEFFAETGEHAEKETPEIEDAVKKMVTDLGGKLDQLIEGHRKLERKTGELERKLTHVRAPAPRPLPPPPRRPMAAPAQYAPGAPPPFNPDE